MYFYSASLLKRSPRVDISLHLDMLSRLSQPGLRSFSLMLLA